MTKFKSQVKIQDSRFKIHEKKGFGIFDTKNWDLFRISNFEFRYSRLRGNSQSGAAALIATIFFLVISLVTISSFVFVGVSQARIARDLINSKRAIAAAESGLEETALRLNENKSTSAFTIEYTEGESQNVSAPQIVDSAYVITANINGVVRKASFKKAGFNFSFPYALMAWGEDDDDEGVIELRNNATVVDGNVWANGDIIGYGSDEKDIIDLGDALIVDGIAPLFYANGKIEKVEFDAHDEYCLTPEAIQAKEYKQVDILGLQLSASKEGAEEDPSGACGPIGNFVEDIATVPPISSDDITMLIKRAESADNEDCDGDCLEDNELDINNTDDYNEHTTGGNFNYRKINGDFRLRHDDEVINLTSDLYITGDFDVNGDGCASMTSDKHRFIIVEGIVKISSNCNIRGLEGARIIIISLSTDNKAIELVGSTGVEAGLLYAMNGGVLMGGSTQAEAVYGKVIEMKGSSPGVVYLGDYYDGIKEEEGIQEWKEVE